MTAMTAEESSPSAPPPRPQPRPRLVPSDIAAFAPVIAAALGSLLLVAAYQAAVHPSYAAWRYPLYWAGMLLAFLPTSARLLGRQASHRERAALVVLLAAITYVPKLLRGSSQPVFTDELLHWYQASRMADGAGLFIDNPVVPAIGHYPVFEATIVLIHLISGLSVWAAGLVLVGIAHAALLLGVRALARELTGAETLADAAAVLYATAPAFGFHTVLMSYESLGMPLAVWALVAAVRATRAVTVMPFVVASCLIVLTSMTHALSSVFLLATLALFTGGAAVASVRRSSSRRTLIVFGGLVLLGLAFNVLWLVWQRFNPFTYLLPPNSGAFSLFSGAAPHVPFSGSSLPFYEVVAGFLAPLVIAALCFVGMFYADRRTFVGVEVRWLLAIICGLYPLTFVGGFNLALGEWVHRPWPYLYVGLAILGAAGIMCLSTPRAGTADPGPGARLSARVVASTMIVAIAILLVGNTADGSSDQYRFPGPWMAGADSRVSTAELIDAATWLRNRAGTGARIVSDKDTANNFLAYAWAVPVSGIGTWELTETERPVDKATLTAMYEQDVQYVVVDQRMATTLNARGYWYGNRDPQAFTQTKPFSVVAVTKLSRVPWASVVAATENLRIYQINRSALAAAAGISVPGR